MNYTVEFSKRSLRQLKSFSKDVQKELYDFAANLANDPHPAGCESVVELPGCCRIRQGDYRIIYKVEGKQLVVLVLAFGNRKDVYKKSEIESIRKIIKEWQDDVNA